SPRGNSFEFAFGTNILDRMLFDQWLANRAEQAGAELHIRTRLIARPEKTLLQVTGPQGSEILKAKVVVGADGPCSLIARTIGSKYANPSRDMSAAVQYVMDGTTADSSVVEMYFGNRIAPGGYLWAIPRGGGQANVGLGLREGSRDLRFSPRDYLNNAIHRHPRLSSEVKNARIVSRVSAFIPVGGPLERTADSNTVLIGDAAGHVMASNGGGIPTALIGGEIAAKSIKNHLELGVPLSAYEASWKKEMGKELNSALSILRIADRVMRSDSLTDQCMRLAGSKYLESMIRCKLPMPVDFASKTLVRILERIE
ncbi:MAG: geranylgeranyl reductase family protein, partial [Candidatus Thorarchaeota archaeon]|nr:geranylgeranyl reductase family protein [Candidatus Thorarchaeota archaeon]